MSLIKMEETLDWVNTEVKEVDIEKDFEEIELKEFFFDETLKLVELDETDDED